MGNIIGTLSQQEINELKKAGHAVYIYPRKGEVVVDGFKRYRLDNPQSCSAFKTYDEWARYNAKRIDIISRNRSLRMQGKPLLPQPARCEPPPKRVVYSREPDGSLTYEGTLREGEVVPEGLILKMEKY